MSAVTLMQGDCCEKLKEGETHESLKNSYDVL